MITSESAKHTPKRTRSRQLTFMIPTAIDRARTSNPTATAMPRIFSSISPVILPQFAQATNKTPA